MLHPVFVIIFVQELYQYQHNTLCWMISVANLHVQDRPDLKRCLVVDSPYQNGNKNSYHKGVCLDFLRFLASVSKKGTKLLMPPAMGTH